MKSYATLTALLLLSACGGLPEGQADGGITRAETEQLNEAADILDSQSAQATESSSTETPAKP